MISKSSVFGFFVNFVIGLALVIAGNAIASSASAAPPQEACPLLTQVEVAGAVNVSVGVGVPMTPGRKQTCVWTPAGDGTKTVKNVTVVLYPPEAFPPGKAPGLQVTPVRGVGDGAAYLSTGTIVALMVKKGNAVFKVVVDGDLSTEKKEAMEKALAQLIASKL